MLEASSIYYKTLAGFLQLKIVERKTTWKVRLTCYVWQSNWKARTEQPVLHVECLAYKDVC